MSKSKFFTMQHSTGINTIFEHAAKRHIESNISTELSANFFKPRKLDRFALRALVKILSRYLPIVFQLHRPESLCLLRVQNIELGKFINATVLREFPGAHYSKIQYLIWFHIFLIYSAFFLGAAMREEKHAQAIAVDNPYYLNGIILDYYLNKPGVWCYVEALPDRALCICEDFANFSQFLFAHDEKLLSSESQVDYPTVRAYMSKRLSNPAKVIDYYVPDTVLNMNKTISAPSGLSVVLYLHSFSDAQMERGFDGFKSIYDWAVFTIQELIATQGSITVYIKAHPNFFHTRSSWTAPYFDRKVWRKFLTRLPEKCVVIDYPVDNSDFLRCFDPNNTVLISHHGNAIIEGGYLGFRSISSTSSPWRGNPGISNCWSNRQELRSILKRADVAEQLQFPSEGQLSKLIANLYIQFPAMNFRLKLREELQMVANRNGITLKFDSASAGASNNQLAVDFWEKLTEEQKSKVARNLVGSIQSV